MRKDWKPGRGKLGLFKPLIGSWACEADTPMGPVRCTRTLEPTLGGAYLQLEARWHFGSSETTAPEGCDEAETLKGKVYEETALIGVDAEGAIRFWSFTSDGKNSQGVVTDVTDLHPQAIGFEAQMPAGTARMTYWPDEEDGFFWAVESKSKKGWSRLASHHYRPVVSISKV